MRSESEILELILNTARRDERVRAVIMNGSRINPNAPKDFFQDYDVVYLVTEKDSFLADPSWITMPI
jgi:aminoglycoside 6-adenylyltransferase